MSESRDVPPGPVVPRGLWGPIRRILRPLAIGLVAVTAAAAVIIWLPLDAAVEADLKTALVGYETAREVAWPATRPITVPLTDADQAALADEVRRGLSAYATGDALAGFDAERAVRRFAEAAVLDQPWVVTKWDGEIVYFEFLRQTLRGDVIVRAGVRQSHQVGRMNEQKQRILARRWRQDDGADILEYRLRSVDGEWKVVTAKHWGAYGSPGQVVEGGPELF